MTAIVTGSGLGLQNSSMNTLGNRGASGNARAGTNNENIYVNAANGNLMIQRQDEFYVSRGLDLSILRTYNSQGKLNDGDNGDNWHIGVYKSVALLSGTINTAGSTVIRTEGDGSKAIYTYDISKQSYVSTAGEGAYDKLTYKTADSTWEWRDGATQQTEAYNALGLIVSSSDVDGAKTTYTYNSDKLITSVTDPSGDTINLTYAGKNLVRLADSYNQSVTSYTYDNLNRLASVSFNLGTTTNGVANKYETTYTYDGDSLRIASVGQTDGSTQTFTYIQVGEQFKIATMTDGQGNLRLR